MSATPRTPGGEARPGDQPHARRRRLRRLAVATSVAGAILVALGAVAFAVPPDPPSALILEESHNGSVRCFSPDASCTLNYYAIDGAPGQSVIAPGQQHVTTVDLRNAGTLAATDLTMIAGPCQNQGPDGIGEPGGDLCSVATVTVTCTTEGPTFSYGPATLTDFATTGAATIVSGLASGASARCTFTVTHPVDGPTVLSTRALQPVTFTLSAAEPPPTTTPPTTAEAVAGAGDVPPPSPGAAPGRGALPVTGDQALLLALTGLALLTLGGLLLGLSRSPGAACDRVSLEQR
jgi:hypothetical protein